MIIRRFAAAGAVALAFAAAVPGAAMASSAGSSPRPVQVQCGGKTVVKRGGGPVAPVARPGCCGLLVKRGQFVKRGRPVKQKVGSGDIPFPALACCPTLIKGGSPPRLRVSQGSVTVAICGTQRMTFDMPAYSSTATEVSGPRLTAHELVVYKQRLFMIRSVSGRSFTLTRLFSLGKPLQPVQAIKPALFTNGATAITDGHAVIVRGLIAVKRS